MSGPGPGPGWLAGDGHPDEQLLAGLGAAVRLFPDLEDALREPAPAAVTLDNAGAFRFLRETGPLLAGAGFGVLLPDWARKARLGLKLTTKSSHGSSAIGPASRIRSAGPRRVPLRPGSGRPRAFPGELAELARAQGATRPRPRPMGRTGRPAPEGRAEVPGAQSVRHNDRRRRAPGRRARASRRRASDGGRGRLARRPAVWTGRRRLPLLSTPGGFRGELRPYQQRGLAWLSFLGELGLGAVLADDMGLGKTVQLLALIGRAPPGQPADAAGVSDVAGRKLAAGGPTVHPRTPGACPPRRGAADG